MVWKRNLFSTTRIFLVTPNQGHLDDFCQRVAYMLSLSLSDLFTTCDKWPFQDFSRCLKDLMGLIWWIMVVGLQIPTYIAAGSGFLRSKAVLEPATSCKHGGSGVGPTWERCWKIGGGHTVDPHQHDVYSVIPYITYHGLKHGLFCISLDPRQLAYASSLCNGSSNGEAD